MSRRRRRIRRIATTMTIIGLLLIIIIYMLRQENNDMTIGVETSVSITYFLYWIIVIGLWARVYIVPSRGNSPWIYSATSSANSSSKNEDNRISGSGKKHVKHNKCNRDIPKPQITEKEIKKLRESRYKEVLKIYLTRGRNNHEEAE